MSMLTIPISKTAAHPGPALPRGRCDNHTAYVSGCEACKTRNRVRQQMYRKASIVGTHAPGLIPAVGAARRLQALAVAGYEAVDIGTRLGVHREQIRRWRTPTAPTISRRRHNDIAALTRQLAGTVGPSRTARTVAHQKGWQPLAAWDDIDNPDEQPQVREAHHHRDPRPLIHRVLTGLAPIDVLTASEQARLWLRWAEQRELDNLPDGPRSFGRQFDISHHRAARIIAAAQQTPTTAAEGRTIRKVA
ncbi:hypothetical protein AB0I89_23580 [Micromonospora sp. NPDC049801]|uniref:hypothetical protein n=1 Tax=unclassified Micromonospora TaxID=2617518 RepID=UPI0033CA89F1